MKVLMLPYELPPYNSGGLGVAALGLINGLIVNRVEVTAVLPATSNQVFEYPFPVIRVLTDRVNSSYIENSGSNRELVKLIANTVNELNPDDYDLIHFHDWLNVGVRELLTKEWQAKTNVLQLHSLEEDRCGSYMYINNEIGDIEKKACRDFDNLITVSEYTKGIISRYTDNENIEVIYNAIDESDPAVPSSKFENAFKVGYIGRFSSQKGCYQLLEALAMVKNDIPNLKLFMIGDGELNMELINYTYSLGIEDNLIFTGFLRDNDKQVALTSLDILVMPSVSEPFGIVALEGLSANTNVIVSKTSGVAEVLPNLETVDYSDIPGISKLILKIYSDDNFATEYLKTNKEDLKNSNWNSSALKLIEFYKKCLAKNEGDINA